MNNIVNFNYAIIFFSAMILSVFFIMTINTIFNDRDDFITIIKISEKMCVKFDYNGQILQYNDAFAKIATINDEDICRVDMFKLISFDNYDEMIRVLFENQTGSKTESFVATVTCRDMSKKRIKFAGKEKKNFLGAGLTYILVGEDVTLLEKREEEYKNNKAMLEKLSTDFRYAEEELKRNFDQIQAKQLEIDKNKLDHKAFVQTIPEGVIEFDFNSRKLFFSTNFIRYFIPNGNVGNTHSSEVLLAMFNFISKDSHMNMIETFYDALNSKKEKFNFTLEIDSLNKYIAVDATITYEDDDLNRMICIATEHEIIDSDVV